MKTLFLNALNKSWAYEEANVKDKDNEEANVKGELSLSVQYTSRLSFSSKSEGKKWFAFIYTSRNISCSLKLPNLVLILLTSAPSKTTSFTANVALAFAIELGGSLISLSRFSRIGAKVVDRAASTIKQTKSSLVGEVVGEAINEVVDGAGDVVQDIVSSSTHKSNKEALTLDRIKAIDKAAYRFVNEDIGELTAIFLSLLVSWGVAEKFGTTMDVEELVMRGAIMLGFEFTVDFIKSWIQNLMGVNAAAVYIDIGFWDAGNCAFNSLAVVFVIYAAFHLI